MLRSFALAAFVFSVSTAFGAAFVIDNEKNQAIKLYEKFPVAEVLDADSVTDLDALKNKARGILDEHESSIDGGEIIKEEAYRFTKSLGNLSCIRVGTIVAYEYRGSHSPNFGDGFDRRLDANLEGISLIGGNLARIFEQITCELVLE